MKKQINLGIAFIMLASSCTTHYKIHVTEPTADAKYYTPMQLIKREYDVIYRWDTGVPVSSRSEAMWQINIWKKHNEHLRRARKKNVYIKVK